ncbi:TPA: hypothetical protein RJN57_000364 [Pseudomonas aeruginosa]|jgi:hypothetical protein|nr:hypothetical protein [Pseudomonas aeruginosa]HDV6122863.1 hypothetical protein [Pseudomonas aeruginosa]HDV6143741.1 hypothetical protein [Pseudomonas aeruginosa]HDV6167201.1 hypothetical protein [Pseudomonas aeruginosa]
MEIPERFNRSQLGRLLDNDEKAKFILHVLEVDWPTALAIVPVAIKAVCDRAVGDEVKAVLMKSLVSYNASMGKGDRVRLEAFVAPMLDGITTLCLAEPPKVDALGELQTLIAKELGEERFEKARKHVVDYLLPHDSPIGQVWRSMHRG